MSHLIKGLEQRANPEGENSGLCDVWWRGASWAAQDGSYPRHLFNVAAIVLAVGVRQNPKPVRATLSTFPVGFVVRRGHNGLPIARRSVYRFCAFALERFRARLHALSIVRVLVAAIPCMFGRSGVSMPLLVQTCSSPCK